MRKLSGLLILILIAIGGVYLAWPDQVQARWDKFIAIAKDQLQEELATLEQLQSGKISIGAPPDTAPTTGQPPPATSGVPSGLKKADSSPKAPLKTEKPVVKPPTNAQKSQTATSRPVPSGQAAPAPIPAVAGSESPETGAPETALGAILKQEVRENQIKEETFWTEERIQEALKNGAPKSKSAPCIAFCDKNDTSIEINMPKAPSRDP
jgi:hypothetical protein